ncbi:MAG: hypothetical protein R3A10_02445 [Caldilineaceae bacterium]
MDHFLAHPPLTLAAVYPYLRARLEVLLPQQIDARTAPITAVFFARVRHGRRQAERPFRSHGRVLRPGR